MALAQKLVLALALSLSSIASSGCERKAPGPEECARFADLLVRGQSAAFGMLLPVTPSMLAKIDSVTQSCLTEPYDRELLDCVLNGGQLCTEDFNRRKGRPSELSSARP